MSSGEIPFKKEMAFDYGVAQEVAPGVRRIIAENPSAFTHVGTNTYVVGKGEVAVIDPGPMIDQHVENIKAALEGETVTHIVVTHTHMDHSPASDWLKELTGAPIVGALPRPQGDGKAVEASQEDFDPCGCLASVQIVQRAWQAVPKLCAARPLRFNWQPFGKCRRTVRGQLSYYIPT